MIKKVQVVLLPTNQKSNALWWSGQKLYNKPPEDPSRGKLNHLYFLSDEKIKEGDWCIMLDDFGNVFSIPQQYTDPKTQHLNKGLRKIIANTDSSLTIKRVDGYLSKESPTGKILDYLPQPSQDFIKVFVEKYNEGNVIEWVDVEYEEIQVHQQTKNEGFGSYFGKKESEFRLKVNTYNEIIINKVKESWNREEVMHLLECAWNGGAHWGSSKTNSNYFDKFISEKL